MARNVKTANSKAAILTGLKPYLEGYVRKHWPGLEMVEGYLDERGAFVHCAMNIKGKEFIIRLRVPKDAPIDARPLFDSVLYKGKVLWRYNDDYRPNIPWGERIRIHMFRFEGLFLLAHVKWGEPFDVVEKVTYLNGAALPEIESILSKLLVAKLWGMTALISKKERKELQQRNIKSLEQ